MKEEIIKILNDNLTRKDYASYYSCNLINEILTVLDKYTYKFDYLEEKLYK